MSETFGCLNRLILDADNLPIVIPFVHTGMQDIMPVGAKLPRIGKTVCNYHFEDGE
uniref:Tafazzin family protein n=1 Tax=Solanum tuberosum TaxID=4113 RepID=M1CAT4_SOLTU